MYIEKTIKVGEWNVGKKGKHKPLKYISAYEQTP